MTRISNRRIRFLRVFILIILGGLLLLLSPLLLVIPQKLYGGDWSELSSVGQSYSGISAFFSAGALIGVAYSLRLQVKQNDMTRRQSVRDMQIKLVGLMLEDPTLASIIQLDGYSADYSQYRKAIFRNLWFRYLHFGYLAGEISEWSLERILKDEIFPSLDGREWWANSRFSWGSGMAGESREHEAFLAIVEKMYAKAMASAGPGS